MKCVRKVLWRRRKKKKKNDSEKQANVAGPKRRAASGSTSRACSTVTRTNQAAQVSRRLPRAKESKRPALRRKERTHHREKPFRLSPDERLLGAIRGGRCPSGMLMACKYCQAAAQCKGGAAMCCAVSAFGLFESRPRPPAILGGRNKRQCLLRGYGPARQQHLPLPALRRSKRKRI